MSGTPELSIVVPAYNEAPAIAGMIRAWDERVRRQGIACEILVYDDGSTDATGSLLTELTGDLPALKVHRQSNRGHGPTILAGYREASGRWVLQVDGDDEVGPTAFDRFWQIREEYDLLVGRRHGRSLPVRRRVLTWASRWAVRLLFGKGLRDVNSPYRLMRREALDVWLAALPSDTFAPNVAISGLALRGRYRVVELDVACVAATRRRAASWSTVAAATRAFAQIVALARRGRAAASSVSRHRTT
jgi:dolichol-phosphate mannosyltransferase